MNNKPKVLNVDHEGEETHCIDDKAYSRFGSSEICSLSLPACPIEERVSLCMDVRKDG